MSYAAASGESLKPQPPAEEAARIARDVEKRYPSIKNALGTEHAEFIGDFWRAIRDANERASQARSQALEEAARVADAQVEQDRAMLTEDRAGATMAMLTGREIAKGIRALISQPPAVAAKTRRKSPAEMTDAELTAADLDYQQREKGDWEGGGSTRETFYERWSDIVEELHRRGLNAPSDTNHGTAHRVDRFNEAGLAQSGSNGGER